MDMEDSDPRDTLKKLDETSSCFCLAKWMQVTIDLEHGTTHSCHHPVRHQVPLEELESNPSALHNTKFKKEQRKQMLEGNRPAECVYCWKVEDSPGEHFSDRTFKSAAYWAHPYTEKVLDSGSQGNINPSYVEMMFGSECNFSCMYCDANISTSIFNEMKKYGPYPVANPEVRMPQFNKIPKDPTKNPYVKAFWAWWPSLAPDLEVFRITGGEPLLNPNTFETFNYILDNPLPNLTLAVNSNLGIKEDVFKKFIEKAKNLTEHNKVRKFEVFTSVDTHGDQANYIRAGLNYSEFIKRVDRVCTEIPSVYLIFMVTFNVLSIPNFKSLLVDIFELKKKHQNRVIVDISHLMHPRFFNSSLITPDFYPLLEECREFMETHYVEDLNMPGFSYLEIEKMKRLISWIKRRPFKEFEKRDRIDFRKFIDEYDRRKGTNFLRTYPELKKFYSDCFK